MAVSIPLTKGAVTLVDEADVDVVARYQWQLNTHRNSRYAIASIRIDGRRRTVGLHRLIMNAVAGQSVDHIDGDGLNNTRANLRLVSRGQNRANSIKHKLATSVFKGVYAYGKRFRAQISSRNIRPLGGPWFIGDFDTQHDAAKAYDACARILFGEHARLNFPRPGERGAHDAGPPSTIRIGTSPEEGR